MRFDGHIENSLVGDQLPTPQPPTRKNLTGEHVTKIADLRVDDDPDIDTLRPAGLHDQQRIRS